ncbi:MAG: hypothetical protein KC649_02955 [Candidatus Omnitrophica bacterium]|nr:hypothetical protein [Candidatus Omnitrophota bacterium]
MADEASRLIRVWQPADLSSISKHLLIIGDVAADCSNCRALGLKYENLKQCPECGTVFNFVTCRSAVGSVKTSGAVVSRIRGRCPGLVFIDYDDYKTLTGKQNARDFFGS